MMILSIRLLTKPKPLTVLFSVRRFIMRIRPAACFRFWIARFTPAVRLLPSNPGAAVVSARRAGTTASIDVINKYFTINKMPVVSSTYWNMVHGTKAEEVSQDQEGLQTMRNIGRNMAWLLKLIENGKNGGLESPQPENGARTNFIR